jgi:hypothetical protein
LAKIRLIKQAHRLKTIHHSTVIQHFKRFNALNSNYINSFKNFQTTYTMAKVMSEEHQAQLAEMIDEYGLHMLMQTLYGGGDVARAAQKSLGTKMPKGQKRAAGRRDKDRLIQRCNDEYPDWNVGDGKGYRVSTLRKSLENGEEPQKTPLSGYMVFMQQERPRLKEDGFSGKDTVIEGGKRWRALSKEDKLEYVNKGRDDVGLPPKELEKDTSAAVATEKDSDEDSTPAANTRSKATLKGGRSRKKAKGGRSRKKATPKGGRSRKKAKANAKGARGRKKLTPPQKEATPPVNTNVISGMFDSSDSSDSDEE